MQCVIRLRTCNAVQKIEFLLLLVLMIVVIGNMEAVARDKASGSVVVDDVVVVVIENMRGTKQAEVMGGREVIKQRRLSPTSISSPSIRFGPNQSNSYFYNL